MNKYVLGIDGMGCGSCEAHVQDVIRRNIKAKSIKASHVKNNLVVISEEVLSIEDFKKILDPTGYLVTSFEKTEAVKKLFGWR
jgi:copper chaperone CopZ